MEARPWTWVDPIRVAASTTPGQAAPSAGCSPSAAPGVAAPMTKLSPSRRTPMTPGTRLRSTIVAGFTRPLRSCTIRSVPPASARAAAPPAASALAAASALSGAT